MSAAALRTLLKGAQLHKSYLEIEVYTLKEVPKSV